MIDYIKGSIDCISPTDVVVETGGIGYHALISLQTYSALENKKEVKLYIHHILREDEELFYGFSSTEERNFFRLLIGVSGVGAGTARIMLSSMSVEELAECILTENVARIKSVKGIGLKTAQRIVLELKDKVAKGEGFSDGLLLQAPDNARTEEATGALVMLGFPKAAVTKVVSALLSQEPEAPVEKIIRDALQRL